MADDTTGIQPENEAAPSTESAVTSPTTPSEPAASTSPVAPQETTTPPVAQPASVPTNIYPTPVEHTAPTPAPAAPIPAAVATPESHNKAASLVIQWMAYAFWGWLVLSLSVLVTLILFSVMGESDGNSGVPYAIASTIVLLPIAFICDRLYSKKENPKKVGGEMAVMVIHAVIFALFAIGSLITAAFTIVSFITGSGDGDTVNTTKTVTLLCSLIIFAFYSATFIRTLAPPSFGWIPSVYRKIMLITVAIAIIAGIVGPTAAEARTKNDRLISSHLSDVSSDISSYAQDNGKLPASLDDLTLSDGSKALVDKKLVDYKPGKLHKAASTSSSSSYSYSYNNYDVYEYQLCVVYTAEKDSEYGSRYNNTNNYTTSYVSTYYHPAGNVCYKLITSEY